MSSNTKNSASKRQLIADAQTASVEGRWEEALQLNDLLLERFPREAETLNRKGRALIELRQLNAAREVYSESLKVDPANMIARRNLQRLEMLYNRADGSLEGTNTAHTTLPKQNTFVEETGKTWVEELANPADVSNLAEVSPGEQLDIVVEDGKVYIQSTDGVRLGEVGAPISERLAILIAGGNLYEVYALGISRQSLRVIIREIHRDPAFANRMSFPEQVRKTQELMRERELLSLREEGDFIFGDDDEDDDADEETDDDADSDDEEEDASEYVANGVVNDDEEPHDM